MSRAESGSGRHPLGRLGHLILCALVATTLACRQDMHDQPKYEPLEASNQFADGKSARPFVEGTVARGLLRDDTVFYTGRTPEDEFTAQLPIELDQALLERGRSRYNAFCSPCHGLVGDGNGMVVQRGFKRPQSFHEQRLLASRVGYFYSVISNGFGQMSSYAAQIEPADRWAIVAYVRALQLSQSTSIDRLTAAEAEKVAHAEETHQEETEGAH